MTARSVWSRPIAPESGCPRWIRRGGSPTTLLVSPRLQPGAWDVSLKGSLVLELDEELHFNRYRLMTLREAAWASDLPWHDDYAAQCALHETECLAAGSWGKRWTNPSCISMFGEGDPPRTLGECGAPRWKQRALYDATKDALAATHDRLSLARISIYDCLPDGGTVGDALDGGRRVNPADLVALVDARST